MPNLNNPHGLRPLGVCQSGGAPVIEPFKKLASYATPIFRNDAVNRAADAGIQTGGTPGTTLFSGVALMHTAASTLEENFLVSTSLDALYEVQATTLAEADLGLNANLLLTAGDAVTKMSKHELNGASLAVTATLDVHVLRRHALPISRNEFGAFCRVEVVFNKHRMAPNAVGV